MTSHIRNNAVSAQNSRKGRFALFLSSIVIILFNAIQHYTHHSRAFLGIVSYQRKQIREGETRGSEDGNRSRDEGKISQTMRKRYAQMTESASRDSAVSHPVSPLSLAGPRQSRHRMHKKAVMSEDEAAAAAERRSHQAEAVRQRRAPEPSEKCAPLAWKYRASNMRH